MIVGPEMKLQFAAIAVLLASSLALASINIADAQWSALETGYAMTTNWHGKDVLPGQSVTATAATTDSLVTWVEFRWLYPNQSLFTSVAIAISGPLTTPDVPPGPIPQEITDWANQHDGSDPKYPQITYWYAQDTQIPNTVGDWGVQAIFHNHDTARIQGKNFDVIAIRATSFNFVPEVPFGTITILFGWLGILGVFALRRKHKST